MSHLTFVALCAPIAGKISHMGATVETLQAPDDSSYPDKNAELSEDYVGLPGATGTCNRLVV